MKKKMGLAVSAVGAALFTGELYRYVFSRKSSPLFQTLFDSNSHDEDYYLYRDAAAERLRQQPCQEYTILSDRVDELKGYYFPCGAQGKKITFIVHGYRSEHTETAGMVYDYYRSRGIDVFTCDHTASGTSQGGHIGFDVLETRDCLRWVKFLRDTFGQDVQILLHGFSMGAATVMQMSSHCPKNVRFIVEDSGYLNAQASLDHQVKFFYQPLRAINRVVAGYDLNDSDVTQSLSKARLPILFVHGRQDKLVPFENGPVLYQMYGGPKDCFFPETARHIEAIYTDPEGYAQKLDQFVEKYLD